MVRSSSFDSLQFLLRELPDVRLSPDVGRPGNSVKPLQAARITPHVNKTCNSYCLDGPIRVGRTPPPQERPGRGSSPSVKDPQLTPTLRKPRNLDTGGDDSFDAHPLSKGFGVRVPSAVEIQKPVFDECGDHRRM